MSIRRTKVNQSGMVVTPFFKVLLAFLDLTVHDVQLHSYHFEVTDQ